MALSLGRIITTTLHIIISRKIFEVTVIVSRWWVPLLLLALSCGPVFAASTQEPLVTQATGESEFGWNPLVALLGNHRQLYAPGRNGRRWRSVTKFVEAQGQPARHGDAENKDSVEDEARRKFERDQQKKANEERFQKVKEDTEKLVQLSNELKDYVGKANEHTLSLDVIKKAEEIERLAKSVKDKMRAN